MRRGSFDNGVLEVYTLNTGQSDSSFVIAPDGSTHLIDADEEAVADELDQLLENRTAGTDAPDIEEAKELDTVIATHIHDDHVAGMEKLAEQGYEANQVVEPDPDRYDFRYENNSGNNNKGVSIDTFTNYSGAHLRMGVGIQDARSVTAGDEVGGTFDVLGPPNVGDEPEKEVSPKTGSKRTLNPRSANANGVVLKTNPESGRSELFTGDLEDTSGDNGESWLMAQDEKGEIDLDADVLHIGHHGSSNATSDEFVEKVDPDLAVISSGEEGYTREDWNHPSDEALRNLDEHDVLVRWTALDGTVETHTDAGRSQGAGEAGADGPHSAADIAALKHYAQENDLDTDDLQEMQTGAGEIEASELGDDVPDWVVDNADVVRDQQTEQEQVDDDDQQTESDRDVEGPDSSEDQPIEQGQDGERADLNDNQQIEEGQDAEEVAPDDPEPGESRGEATGAAEDPDPINAGESRDSDDEGDSFEPGY